MADEKNKVEEAEAPATGSDLFMFSSEGCSSSTTVTHERA